MYFCIMSETRPIIFCSDRWEWRKWLSENHDTAKEIWFVFPTNEAHEESVPYNDAVEAGGLKYSAYREIELDANSHFVKTVTTFSPVGHDADSMNVVLGAVTHEVISRANGQNWIAFTEKASDSKQPDVDGNISIALVYDAAELADNVLVGVGDVAEHAAILTHEAVNKPVTVWTGSGWSQGGVASPQEWEKAVCDFAYAKANPLITEIIK